MVKLVHLFQGADSVVHGNQDLNLALEDEIECLASLTVLEYVSTSLQELVVHLLENVDAELLGNAHLLEVVQTVFDLLV